MARDIEAEVKVKDGTKPGLDSVERRFRESGKKIEKEYDRFGKSSGDKILRAVGAVSPQLAKRLSAAFGDAASLGAPLLISGVAAAMPGLSALVGAAVTGGAAGLGIVGGVALAARDARVKAAGTNLAATLLAGLSDRAGTFVQPVLNSIKIMEDAFARSGDKLESIFSKSSRFVEPLAATLAGVGENLISGLELAVGRAGPVMDALNRGLQGTGEAIESFIDDVTSNSAANAAILEQTFASLNTTIVVVGEALGGLADIFGFLNSVMPLSVLTTINELFGVTAENARKTGSGTFGAAEGIRDVGDAAKIAETDARLFNKALEDNARAARDASAAQASLFDDATRVGEAFDNAREAAKKNGASLDANSKKGRANRDALSQLAGALNKTREDFAKTGASAGAVTGKLNTQRGQLIKVINSMGTTGAAARALADKLLGIKNRNVSVKVNAAGAAQTAKEVRLGIEAIHSKTVTVSVNVNASRLASVERRLARVGGGFAGLTDSFGLTAPGQLSRTGGPLEVISTVENHISLDGKPFRNYVDNRLRASEAKDRHRRRYGGRHL